MTKGLYYLAGPHKGTPTQETYRVQVSLRLTTDFLRQGIHVFSPIIYALPIAEALHTLSVQERRELIMTYLLDFLTVSKGMIVITMEGWEESWGLRQELNFCHTHQIPVYTIAPDAPFETLPQILTTPLDQGQMNQILKAA